MRPPHGNAWALYELFDCARSVLRRKENDKPRTLCARSSLEGLKTALAWHQLTFRPSIPCFGAIAQRRGSEADCALVRHCRRRGRNAGSIRLLRMQPKHSQLGLQPSFLVYAINESAEQVWTCAHGLVLPSCCSHRRHPRAVAGERATVAKTTHVYCAGAITCIQEH
jgi:hypothetical protein